MDMFSPYYDLAKQLRFRIARLRLIKENLKQVHPLFQTVFKTFPQGQRENRQRSSVTLF